jgi:ATP-binding cassette subfamily C protein EexD
MLIAGSILLGRALAPIDQMIGGWRQFGEARSAYKRINETINKPLEQTKKITLPKLKGKLDVEELIVIPPGGEKAIIQGISLSLNPGEILGLIGASASGKTTLAKTLIGVWPISRGKVRLDGAELSQWNEDELGPNLGYLPQDVELFDGSIAENIARFGELDDAAIVEAATIAGVHDMILALPKGYQTQVGSGGIFLSGGQRQRVGLARAIYKKPKFIILDEPNAHLDETGEQALAQAMIKLKFQGCTQIVISHRPGLLNVVDKILVLAEGRIKLLGTKQAVLEALQTIKTKPVIPASESTKQGGVQ